MKFPVQVKKWARTGINNYNEAIVGSPGVINVLHHTFLEKVYTPDRVEWVSTAQLFTVTDVNPGDLIDVTNESSNLHTEYGREVKQVHKITNNRGTRKVLKVYL